MHNLTEPQVSAHECAKPGENDGNANVPRRGTTLLLASRRGGAAPGVLIVPLRGTIRETVIINPMFAAVAAPKHGALSNNASSTHHILLSRFATAPLSLNCTPKVRHKTFEVQFLYETLF